MASKKKAGKAASTKGADLLSGMKRQSKQDSQRSKLDKANAGIEKALGTAKEIVKWLDAAKLSGELKDKKHVLDLLTRKDGLLDQLDSAATQCQ